MIMIMSQIMRQLLFGNILINGKNMKNQIFFFNFYKIKKIYSFFISRKIILYVKKIKRLIFFLIYFFILKNITYNDRTNPKRSSPF